MALLLVVPDCFAFHGARAEAKEDKRFQDFKKLLFEMAYKDL